MADGHRHDNKHKRMAFIFIDDDQAVFGTLSCNSREVLFKLPSNVPKNPSTDPHRTFTYHQHRCRYVFGCKIRLFARWFFIDAATTLPIVDGFIVTGPAHLIPDFLKSNFIHPCLTAILEEVDDANPHRITNASDFSDDSPVYDDSLYEVVVDGFIVTGPAHLIPDFLKSNFIHPCLTAILEEVDDANPHRITNASDFSDDSPVYDDSLYEVVVATLPAPPPPLEHLKILLSGSLMW